SVGAVSVLYWGVSLPFLGNFTLPVVSVLCAMGTIFFLLFFVRMVDRMLRIETLILSGVILGSFLGSVLSLIMAFSDDELKSIVSWLLGSVSYRSMDHVWLLLPFFILGFLLLLFLAPQIQALALGEERAHYLGVNVKVVKYSVLIVAALLTGASVSVSGSIAFVGLVIPHAVRMLIGPNVRQTFVLCTIIGGGALVWTDIISRSIAAPLELPIGVVTSFVGAPIFAYIMYKERRKKYS
ncbi:MAG: FecCD family ABC transporter permease, partial [Bacilli bacterium]